MTSSSAPTSEHWWNAGAAGWVPRIVNRSAGMLSPPSWVIRNSPFVSSEEPSEHPSSSNVAAVTVSLCAVENVASGTVSKPKTPSPKT
jgi:hypothetical protein